MKARMAAGSGTWAEIRATGQLGRFLLLCLGVWLHAADALVTATAMPAIVADIGGVPYVAWTLTLYQIGAIVAGAATALLCGRHGTGRVLGVAALLYGTGCLIAALAPSMAVLLLARLLQGLGGGALLSLGYIAIQQSFAEHLWGRLFGIQALLWAVGSLLGPLIGGVFVEFGFWRGVFWFFVPQAALLWLLAGSLAAPAGRRSQGALPAGRMALLTVAALAIAQAGVTGGAASALALVAAGLALLWLAARLDRRAGERMLPAGLLSIGRPLGAGLLAVFALSVATTGFWAYGPLLLETLFGVAPLVSGYLLAAEALAWSAATMAIAAVPVSAGTLLIRIGTAMVSAGAAGLAIAVPAGSLAGIVACLLLQGCGMGLCWPAIVQRTVRCAEAAEATLAAAAPGTVQRIGFAVGAAATGIAANLAGLADGVSPAAARAASFWVFAAFIPVLAMALAAAWRFTAKGSR
ncbi:MAG: MFS transporter [Geminicoccaceae bacterium]